MDFFVNYSCENDSETGRTKLTVSDFDNTSIRDVKYAIQDAIQAPVCDQRLFYQGQPVTDDDMPLSRLYFREGDCFKLQFLAVADIPGMRELLDVLKNSAQKIVETFQRQLPDIEDGSCLWRFYERIVYAFEGLASFFFPWKCLRSVAHRHFFVQEGGFDAILEVFKFSRQLYAVGHPENISDFPILIEYDSNIQEEVSKMSPLIDKLIFMIDRCQSQPAGYSLFSSQVASNTLFYCTFNVKSAQPLVDCGALEKMTNITKKLLFENDSNTPLRYYCCLFLARMRSAPLVTLDRDTCVAIDELIDEFLSKHVPSEISKWEDEYSFVWMTMVPLVHLAFAAGKEYYCDQINGLKGNASQSEEACFLGMNRPQTAVTVVNEAGSAEMKESQSMCSHMLSSDNREVFPHQASFKQNRVEDHFTTQTNQCLDSFVMHDESESMETETLVSGDNNCVMTDRKDQFTWPGSISTLKLGIFCLVHMLSIKENQQLALTENLLPYLVCLSWHLKCDEREKLRNSLENFHNFSTPPSLKVITKSVLALVNGLDMVFNL